MRISDYCDYKLSLALKAAGFNEPCGHCYAKTSESEHEFIGMITSRDYNKPRDGEPPFLSPICSAVPLWQAQKWLREKRGIAINVIAHDGGAYDYDIVFLPNAVDCDSPIDRATFSRTYEEALSEGITSVLELIKKGE